ncbi:MAG: RNA polymerase sigma factor [Microscillaceae bacterium]|nr:RNA polymerase sigma factor [Microscillaceae bacterium]
MTISPDEKKIVKGCKAGKAKYQQILYERYYGKMLSLCMRYTQTREEAKDVLHDGYIKIFKSMKDFQEKGSLEGWIRKIVINTAINYYHKNKKYHANLYLEDECQDMLPLDHHEEDIISKLSYDDIIRFVRTLPPAYMTVFNLYAIEGYNHREIAEMLNISEGTSKSNLAKARMKLQKKIQESLEDKPFAPYVQKS